MRRAAVGADKATGLQKFMQSRLFDGFMMAVIMLNCIVMAMTNPRFDDAHQAQWIISLNWFFNIIYVLEVSVNIFAFGVMQYLMDPWHYIDVVVSAVSAIDIAVVVLSAISVFFGGPSLEFTGDGAENLKLLRVVRVLRPLKAISFIPSLLVFIESILQSGLQIGANMLLLLMIQFVFAAVGCAWIGDALSYRCQPIDVTDANVQADIHFQTYGASYFTSVYNVAFCGADGE